MDSATIAIIVILLAVFLGGLGYCWYYLAVNILNPTGKGAAKKTARALAKFASIRRFRVVSDVTLNVDGKTAHIENMLVGYFGILLVHTLGARGEYYGTTDGENWIVTLAEKRSTFPNPILEQQRAMALLRTALGRNKLFKMPIESIVYLTSRAKKTGLFITNDGQILMPGKLGGYLGKTKFDKDIGLDVSQVVDVIAANSK